MTVHIRGHQRVGWLRPWLMAPGRLAPSSTARRRSHRGREVVLPPELRFATIHRGEQPVNTRCWSRLLVGPPGSLLGQFRLTGLGGAVTLGGAGYARSAAAAGREAQGCSGGRAI
jgi:hypothetical protein